MTLDDLERPKRHSCRNKTVTGPTIKISTKNEDRSILSAAKCMILVSRNIRYRYMFIFAGVPRGGGVKYVLPYLRQTASAVHIIVG